MPDTQTSKNLEDLYSHKVLYLLPLIKEFLKNILFLCLVMWVMCVYSGAQAPMEAWRMYRRPEVRVRGGCEPPQREVGTERGPLQEQQVLVTAERQDI